MVSQRRSWETVELVVMGLLQGPPQSIGAQLEHQPTRKSAEHAKKQTQAQILTCVTAAIPIPN